MAAQTCVHAQSATLVTTNPDSITFTGKGKSLVVSNRHATEWLWVRLDGVTAVAAADENYAVAPASSMVFDAPRFGGTPISVIGNANPYTVGIF